MFRLVLNSLRHSPGRSVLLAIPILLGAFSVTIIACAYLLSRSFAMGTVSGLGENEMVVGPRLVETPFLFRKDEVRPLSEKALAAIEAVVGVSSVQPRFVLQGIASVRIAILGQVMESDTPLYGISPEGLTPDITSPTGTIPIMLSRSFVSLMGTTLADALGFPRLSENLLIGREVTIITGHPSFFPSRGNGHEWRGRIVGLSDRVPFVGLSLPVEDLERMAQESATTTKISDVLVSLSPDADPVSVQRQIEALGFATDTLSQRLGRMQERLSLLSSTLSGITLLLLTFVIVSVGSVTSSDILLHTRTIGIMRSFGARKPQIRTFFLTRTLIVTLFSVAIGTCLGILTAFFLWRAFLSPAVPWLSAEVIPWTLSTTVVLVTLTALISSLPPILRANRLSPVRALGEEN